MPSLDQNSIQCARVDVAFILPNFHNGGAERFTLGLADWMARNGHSVTLIVLSGEGELARSVPQGVHLLVPGIHRMSRSLFFLRKYLKTESPEFLFSGSAPLSLLIGWIAPILLRRTKLLARETSIPSHRVADQSHPILFRILYRRVLRHFDRVVCQAKAMQEDLVRGFGLAEKKTIVINNPLPERCLGAPCRVVGGWPARLLCVGNLTPVKDHALALKALTHLPEDFAKLVIVGDGPERERLTELAADLGLRNRIEFTGYLDDPLSRMIVSSLLLITSRIEGFPNVALEAISVGLPVVGLGGHGGLREIVRSGVNGKVIETREPESLARAIEEVLSLRLDPTKIREDALNRFHPDKIYRQYEMLFEEVRTG